MTVPGPCGGDQCAAGVGGRAASLRLLFPYLARRWGLTEGDGEIGRVPGSSALRLVRQGLGWLILGLGGQGPGAGGVQSWIVASMVRRRAGWVSA